MNPRILGVVLAGGESVRFRSDKASAKLLGKTLLERVCERAEPQVDVLLINRNEISANALPHTILPDGFPGEGPLAGVLAALERAQKDGFSHVATFPCDTPFFPKDMVVRLRDGLSASQADVCVARRGSDEHRAFALWSVTCAPMLSAAFVAGLRSLQGVGKIVLKTTIDFPALEDGRDDNAFFNINTTEDLAYAERWLGGR